MIFPRKSGYQDKRRRFPPSDNEFLNCWTLETNRIFPPCVWEYLNFKGAKLSESRSTTVEVPYFLSKYDPDALRFYLIPIAPETRDLEFSREN